MKNITEFDIILRPRVTEKSNSYEQLAKYSFIVAAHATKKMIKEAVEMIYKSKVSSVNVLNVVPKKKIFKGRKGSRPGFRKAIVTFEKGEKIDILKGV